MKIVLFMVLLSIALVAIVHLAVWLAGDKGFPIKMYITIPIFILLVGLLSIYVIAPLADKFL